MSVRCGYCKQRHPAELVSGCAEKDMSLFRRRKAESETTVVRGTGQAAAMMAKAEANMARLRDLQKEPIDHVVNQRGLAAARAALRTGGRDAGGDRRSGEPGLQGRRVGDGEAA